MSVTAVVISISLVDIYAKENRKVKLDVCNSKYDHYLYTRYHDEYDEYSCVNLWSGAVIETVELAVILVPPLVAVNHPV